jgi:hypothetical protein
MNAIELDVAVRRIFATVTPHTSLTATRELTEMGFTPRVAWLLVCRVLSDNDDIDEPLKGALKRLVEDSTVTLPDPPVQP